MAPNTSKPAENEIDAHVIQDRASTAFRKLCAPPTGEDVVIAGIAGKYPCSDNIDQFRDNLYDKVDMLSADDRRWRPHPGVPLRSGKLNDISSFDPGYFGIDRRHADFMDPIIRLLLERSFEAILDAGYNPSELRERKVGVFIGCSFSETEKVIMYDKRVENGRAPIGATFSMIPQAISYYFGLQGPSYISDSGCSSSLYVLAHAFKNIRDGNCDMALVGGANLCLHAVMSLQYARLGVLSFDGNCKTFDSSANGFVRSESASVILLQRSRDARRVYARVLHCKQNCDGFKEEGFAFPSTQMQTALLRETYQECGVDVSDVGYVEAHGTGTFVGDAQELTTLSEVFCRKERDRPLHIGSVKSNAGHTECTAGLTSIAKIVISMENERIPPNRNFVSPREGFGDLEAGKLRVVSEATRWPDGIGLAGINSFGIGGANAHAVLQWNTRRKLNCSSPRDDLPRLVCVSARCEEAVGEFLDGLNRKPLDAELVQLAHSIFGKDIANHPFRGYSLLNASGEVKRSVKKSATRKGELAWAFSPHETSWFAVAEHLTRFPLFTEQLKRIQKRMQKKLADDTTNPILETITVQIGLGETLRALGVKPDSATGWGTGAITAAYFNDFLTLDEVIFVCTAPFCEDRPKNMRDLLEYLGQNTATAFDVKNATCLVIGAQIGGLEGSSLLSEFSTDPVSDFLSALGSLYEQGHSIELAKLYPKLPWPVGRGTPMISPLIKWRHDRNFFVALKKDEDEVRNAQRVVHVAPKEPEWKYLAGHVVDGRNLFPATAFLTTVWETLAKEVGKSPDDMRVLFEDVKFLRAVNLTGRDDVEMIVTIQRGDGNFEVCEGGHVAVTGRICEMHQDGLTNLHVPAEECVGGITTMTQDDVYKELGIRGYRFKGPFKGIKECDIGANKGQVAWSGNWALFLDAMLQLKVLHIDTRNLRVPVHIGQLMIDGPKHARVVGDAPEKILSVYVHEELDLTRSEAVEFRQTVTKEVRKKKTGLQILETYKFIPYSTTLNTEESVRVMLQLILENHPSAKFKSVELAAEHLESLSPHIKKAVDALPLVQAETVVLPFNGKLGGEGEVLVVIVPQLSDSEELLGEALRAIEDTKGFIVTREKGYFDASASTLCGLNVLSVHTNKLETLVLLQKPPGHKEHVAVDISGGLRDMKWLRQVQGAQQDDRRLILFAQNQLLSGILGFVNSLRKEAHGNKAACFFIAGDAPEFDLDHPFYKVQAEKNLAVNVWRDGKWGTYRHLRVEENALRVQRPHCYAGGDSTGVRFVEGPLDGQTALPTGKELVHVYYAGLNPRDVQLANEELPADVASENRVERGCLQGLEFVGRDGRGQRVMGVVRGKAVASCVAADSELLWPIPESWSLEDAATIPVSYSVAIYSLIMKAHLQRGQTVLINACTEAIGLAALNVALHYDCDVFVTTDTSTGFNYVRRHYPQIPEGHVGKIEDASFEHVIHTETRGRGVELIFNPSPQKALRSCLAAHGHLIEVGGFNDMDLCVQKGAAFHGVALDVFLKDKGDLKARICLHMVDLIGKGVVRPLPRSVFDMNDLADAYKYLADERHLGKVLVKVRDEKEATAQLFQGVPRYFCLPECSYVILGGLGGFGLELCDWLIVRGARKLVLNSRGGLRSGYAASKLRLWGTYGVRVEIRTDDVTTEEGCADLINYAGSLGPVKGVFNLAVVLKDAPLENQTEEGYVTVFNPKAVATGHLDVLTRKMCPNLSDFVVFSSLACGRGNAGQTNYAMANSVMERICERRKSDGYPALAIQWGAIGDVGIVANIQRQNNVDADLTIAGTLQQRIADCLGAMDVFLRQKETIVASMVVAEKRTFDSAGDIVDVVCNMLGVVDLTKISEHATFPELGMDSMTSLEIKQVLRNEYDIIIKEQDMRAMTFAKFKELAEAKTAEKEDRKAKPQ